MRIREMTAADWPQVWPILRKVVRAEETFPYDPAMTEADAQALWAERPPVDCSQLPGAMATGYARGDEPGI